MLKAGIFVTEFSGLGSQGAVLLVSAGATCELVSLRGVGEVMPFLLLCGAGFAQLGTPVRGGQSRERGSRGPLARARAST